MLWSDLVTTNKNITTEYLEFPLGIFLLSTPKRKDENGQIIREIEAFDGLQVLLDDKFTQRYVIAAGTNYKQAIITILNGAGITKINIEDTTEVLPKPIEYEIGKEKLFAINDLLSQINFETLKVDVNGYYTSMPYKNPAIRAAEYTYADDDLSIIYQGVEEEVDLFNIPNKWVIVKTNAEEQPLVSVYTNDNPDSITSTVSRGRTIVEYREIEDIASQASLDAYTERVAFEASQIYGRLVFETALMPIHDILDILQVKYSKLNINDKYTETNWSMPLTVGGKMKHECRKVINI